MTRQIRHRRHSKYGKPFSAGSRKIYYYPTSHEIMNTNKRIIATIRVDRKDRFLLLRDKEELDTIIKETKLKKGDIYDKAVFLLKSITQAHIFQSANRRTAYSVARGFLLYNLGEAPWFSREKTTKIMKGIRLGDYDDAEIKHWLKTGEIHE